MLQNMTLVQLVEAVKQVADELRVLNHTLSQQDIATQLHITGQDLIAAIDNIEVNR